MTDIDFIADPKKRVEERLKLFANAAIGIISDKDAVNKYVLEGVGKGYLEDLIPAEKKLLERLIAALSEKNQ